MNKIEKEYRKIYEENVPEINAKIALATKLIFEAQQIADEYGIAFATRLEGGIQSYVPNSLYQKFGEMDSGFLEIFDVYTPTTKSGKTLSSVSNYYGWITSSDFC